MLPYCPAVTPLIPTTAWAIMPSAGHRRGSDGIAGTSYSAMAKRTASPAERCGQRADAGRRARAQVGQPRDAAGERPMRASGQPSAGEPSSSPLPRSLSDRGHGGCSRPAPPYSRPSVPAAARAVVWAARVAWLAVAIAGGAAIGEALSEHGRAVQLAGTAAAWTGWAVGGDRPGRARASSRSPSSGRSSPDRSSSPSSPSSTGPTRQPASPCSLPRSPPAPSWRPPSSAACYIQASAYGAESRFGLRPPIGYLLACVATWLAHGDGRRARPPGAGRAGVGTRRSSVLVVARLGLALLPRRWHQLSRRWLVLVPAGIVVHDPVVLADTLMLPRRGDRRRRPRRSRRRHADGRRPHRSDPRTGGRDPARRTGHRRARPDGGPPRRQDDPRSPPSSCRRHGPAPSSRRPPTAGYPTTG